MSKFGSCDPELDGALYGKMYCLKKIYHCLLEAKAHNLVSLFYSDGRASQHIGFTNRA
jgi:hypothetical protein